MKKETKELLKKVPGLHSSVRLVKERVIDAKAISCFLAERKIKRTDGPIKVGFICQYIPAWTKVEGLYRAMLEDPRFEPYLLCVPYGIENNVLLDPECLGNDTYEYFCQNGYTEAINTLIGKNEWLDLSQFGLSYIFYVRPYNTFMPFCYTSKEVSRYSRICLVLYGFILSENLKKTILNRDFLSQVYFYFAEFQCTKEYNIKNNRLLHMLGFQKTESLGYPIIETLHSRKNDYSPAWDFSTNRFRVMWTPRWTTDLKTGGSNFFQYYQTLLDFAAKHTEIDFLFRPHPMAFQNFINTGEMTRAEVETYKKKCESLHNVRIDREQEYEATFWASSVLVSDYSGIMPEYFTTGKPLIFCASNMCLELTATIKRMLEGCYVVNNEEELFKCLLELQRGNDVLQEKRLEICKELFSDWTDSSCKNIIEALAEDFYHNKGN